VVLGYRALGNLPIEAFPDVQDVQVQIVTQYPGQAPEEVERAITLPIEREMSGVPRQTQLRSVTITGLSVVTLTFADGTDDYFARSASAGKIAERDAAGRYSAGTGAADHGGRRNLPLHRERAGGHGCQ